MWCKWNTHDSMLDAFLTNKRKNPTNKTVPLERVPSWMPNYTSMHTHINNGFDAVLKKKPKLMYGEWIEK